MKQLLTELFDRYYRDVYGYLYSLSRDHSLSEDLTQEVFLEVVRSISTFRGESDVKTWLFSIARHRWFAHLRRKDRQIKTESIHDLYDCASLSTTDPHDRQEMLGLIDGLLQRESETTASVLRLRMEGFSYFEIAQRLGISENSARVIYFRIKTKIKNHLEQEGFGYE